MICHYLNLACHGISLLKLRPALVNSYWNHVPYHFWNQTPPWYITTETRPHHSISLLKPDHANIYQIWNQAPIVYHSFTYEFVKPTPWNFTYETNSTPLKLNPPPPPPSHTPNGKSLLKPGPAMRYDSWNLAHRGILLWNQALPWYITA